MKTSKIKSLKPFYSLQFLSVLLLLFTIYSCNKKTGNFTIKTTLEFNEGTKSSDISQTISILTKRLLKYGIEEKNFNFRTTNNKVFLIIDEADDTLRLLNLLTPKGKLEFWETYELKDMYSYFIDADKKVAELLKDKKIKDFLESDSLNNKNENIDTSTLVGKVKAQDNKNIDVYKENPLFTYLGLNIVKNSSGQQEYGRGANVAYCLVSDTPKVNKIFKLPEIQTIFPKSLKLLWGVKPFNDDETVVNLYAIKITTREKEAPLDGSDIKEAKGEVRNGSCEVFMSMNSEGAKIWKRLTRENVDKAIAIVIDDKVYSAPFVMSEIAGGKSQISGNFTKEEAQDLANVIQSGKYSCNFVLKDIQFTIKK